MNLLINEFAKDYKKKTTWMYIILYLGIISLSEYFSYKFTNGGNAPENPASLWINICSAAISVSSIFVLIMLANNLSQEYSRGTIKFLYSKPKSRSAILTAKIVASLINYIIFVIIGTAFTFAVRTALYKNAFSTSLLKNKIEEGYFGRTVLEQILISNSVNLAVMVFYISLVVIVCILARTQILSLILVMISVLGGNLIQGLTVLAITKYEWVKYHMFDASLYSAYYESEAGRQFLKELYKFTGLQLGVMLVAYTLVFFVVSYIINARRDITLD